MIRKKYFITTLIISLILIISGTFAWLFWQSEENTNFTLNIGEVAEVLFNGGNEIKTVGIGPVISEEEGEITEFQILKKIDDLIILEIGFNPSVLPDGLKEESFKYKLYSKNSLEEEETLVTEGNFKDKIEGSTFSVTDKLEVTSKTSYYRFVIYIDGNMLNPSTMKDQTFEGKILVTSRIQATDMGEINSVYVYNPGKEEIFIAPFDLDYKLEAWGGQGGDATSTSGGYGGYSTGIISLKKEEKLYINVGGKGSTTSSEIISGGYNGGGSAKYSNVSGDRGSGGGASSIALKTGLLKDLSNNKDSIILVAGGGGGGAYYDSSQAGNGGSGGGIEGNAGGAGYGTFGQGGTQDSAGTGAGSGAFGQGGIYGDDSSWGGAGGGGGYYGGGGAWNNSGGGGGSGYIGNVRLKNKYMYCHNCTPSDLENTRTYTTTDVSSEAISNYSKMGEGAVKITLLIPGISNLNSKRILLGEEFNVTSDVKCLDNGSGCEIIETKILDDKNNIYSKTSLITIAGTYDIQYTITDINNNKYIYHRPLKVVDGFSIVGAFEDEAKTLVTNNGINYEYAKNVSLMKDTAGNIRYYGSDPSNFVYFNCADYSNQTADTCELWRIIGTFNGKIKIIRNTSIGSYSWDTDATYYGENKWNDSAIMKLLNPGYDGSTGGSLYYNAKSGQCYIGQANKLTSCSFTSTGLKNDQTRNMIADNLYNLGSHDSNTIFPNQIYTYERGTGRYDDTRPLEWTGKIGLMYPSDYAYAADLSICDNKSLDQYSDTSCTSNNWLAKNEGLWTITPQTRVYNQVFYIYTTGSVGCGYYSTDYQFAIRPVLFLKEELNLVGGKGTSYDPYRIG